MLKKIFEEVVDGKKVNLDIAKVMLEPVDYLDLQVLKERVKG